MSKTVYTTTNSAADEGSVLRQWEQMHRPPENIPKSGPRDKHHHGGGGLVVDAPPSSSSSMLRRHSVVSSSKDNVTLGQFPLRTNGSTMMMGHFQQQQHQGGKKGFSVPGGGGDNNNSRRQSDMWMGRPLYIIDHTYIMYECVFFQSQI